MVDYNSKIIKLKKVKQLLKQFQIKINQGKCVYNQQN